MSKCSWINPAHKLPAVREKVLVACWIVTKTEAFWFTATGFISESGRWHFCSDPIPKYASKKLDVRYWMPIPPLPEVKDGA